MLLTKKLIEGVAEKYIPMLETVNIPNFTKCIAEFSGLGIDRIPDDMIKEYLLTWAANKYKFYQMLGNKTKFDQPFIYNNIREDIKNDLIELQKEFPAYALWLDEFSRLKTNSISLFEISWRTKDIITTLFPNFKLGGASLTAFFKRMLNAPDDLVTKLGHIFEYDKIEATHTISIDPVDMMLASENPYNWNSCYRLENYNSDSHADGCLAAVLDTSSLITYVWNHEGELQLYGNYVLKDIRYKRMRQWIALSENLKTIHFNTVYPTDKHNSIELQTSFRAVVEKFMSDYLDIENKWKTSEGVEAYRRRYYGYNEFRRTNMYTQSYSEPQNIFVYTEEIKCPCGCGLTLEGSDANGCHYDGGGFIYDNFSQGEWCDYIDDYCDSEECGECVYWRDAHPVCDLDEGVECPDPVQSEVTDGIMESYEGHCHNCPYWESCSEDDE